MASEKYTVDQVIAAIESSYGIKETIRRRLGCSRNTVDNYLDRYATARQAYNEEVARVGDIAEAVIIDDMTKNRNVKTAKWYAAQKLKDRGYGTTRNEHEHHGNLSTSNVTVVLPDNGRNDRD